LTSRFERSIKLSADELYCRNRFGQTLDTESNQTRVWKNHTLHSATVLGAIPVPTPHAKVLHCEQRERKKSTQRKTYRLQIARKAVFALEALSSRGYLLFHCIEFRPLFKQRDVPDLNYSQVSEIPKSVSTYVSSPDVIRVSPEANAKIELSADLADFPVSEHTD
jgi:hypothetical protein